MEEKRLQVLLVRPNCKPVLTEISDSLEEMQKLVGGDIEEYMPFNDDAAIICNDEGKIRRLQLNRAIYTTTGELGDVIAGDFFICRAPIESESFQSLTLEQIEKYKETFRFPVPERFFIAGNGKIVAEKIMPKNKELER